MFLNLYQEVSTLDHYIIRGKSIDSFPPDSIDTSEDPMDRSQSFSVKRDIFDDRNLLIKLPLCRFTEIKPPADRSPIINNFNWAYNYVDAAEINSLHSFI